MSDVTSLFGDDTDSDDDSSSRYISKSPTPPNIQQSNESDNIWNCSQCDFINYNEQIACKACFNSGFNLTETLNQLYNDAANATKIANNTFNEIIKAINDKRNELLTTIHELSKHSEQKLLNTNFNQKTYQEIQQLIPKRFEMNIDKHKILSTIDSLCKIETSKIPNPPSVSINWCSPDKIQLSLKYNDFDQFDIYKNKALTDLTAIITGCKIRFAEYNESMKQNIIKLNWNIMRYDTKESNLTAKELKSSTQYVLGASAKNCRGWSDWSESIPFNSIL